MHTIREVGEEIDRSKLTFLDFDQDAIFRLLIVADFNRLSDRGRHELKLNSLRHKHGNAPSNNHYADSRQKQTYDLGYGF